MKKKLLVLLIAPLIFSVYISARDVPLTLQARLMLKILSLDQSVERYGDPIKIGVNSDKFLKALTASAAGGLKVKGKKFLAEKMTSVDDISKYKVIYVSKAWAGQYTAISQKAVDNKCLMFCETTEGVLSGGGSISFRAVGGKPKVLMSLENARNQGANFPANFLKITVVIGGLE